MEKKITIKTKLISATTVFLMLSLLVGFNNYAGEKVRGSVIDDHKDMGGSPWVLDIEEATIENNSYRIAKWSGEFMQMVLMSISPGEVIDLEIHEHHDQFIRIEEGEARVLMGKTEDNLDFDKVVSDDWSIFIPAGYWHQVINTGNSDLKLYTIYAPGEHERGTHHETYQEAADDHHHHH
ncbi:MAG: cupin domain-containing protein [Bacteroidales bacterium]